MSDIKKYVIDCRKWRSQLSKIKESQGFVNYLNYKPNGVISNFDNIISMIIPEIKDFILDAEIMGDLQTNTTTLRIMLGEKEIRLMVNGDDVAFANRRLGITNDFWDIG